MYIRDECEVFHPSEPRATITRVKDKIRRLEAGCRRWRTLCTFLRETKICACAYFAHVVCKTATFRTQNKHEKASFAHSVKKQYISILVCERDFTLEWTFRKGHTRLKSLCRSSIEPYFSIRRVQIELFARTAKKYFYSKSHMEK